MTGSGREIRIAAIGGNRNGDLTRAIARGTR